MPDALDAGRAAGARRCAGQSLLRLASSATRRWSTASSPRRRKVVKLDLDQQPADPERDGAARGDRRLRSVHRRLHALHHQPEPARDPAADGRLRAAHPGEQAARRRAGCRRRLRLEDLSLRRRGDRHLGGRQAAPAGEVDRRAHRKLHVRRAWPRPCQHRRDGARRATASSSALRVSTLANMGAYLSTFAPCVPTYLYATLLAGVYKTPVIYCEVKAVFTNTVPVDAYRGAGRPEATFLLERLVDVGRARHRHRSRRAAAAELHPGRRLPVPDAGGAAIRQRRLPDDAGCRAEGRPTGPASRRAARRRRRAASCAASAFPPISRPAASRRRPWSVRSARAPGCTKCANIRVHPTGSVTVFTGTHSHGQGHETTLAQLVVDQLGVPLDQVEVVHGDTGEDPVRHGHLWQPQPRGRRHRRWSRRWTRSSPRARRSPPT